MNEKTTATDLKYQNKLKLEAICRSYNLIVQQKNNAKAIVDQLYALLQLYLANQPINIAEVQQKLKEFEDTLLFNNDVLMGNGG